MTIEKHCFRLLDSGPQEAFVNMAVDQAIAHSVETGRSKPTIRFYTWAAPALSIGAFQPIREVNLDRCRTMGIPIVRRITGGRALLHEAEMTYSVTCPIPSPFFPSNLQDCCRIIAEALQIGLQQIGLTAQIVPPTHRRRTKPHAPDCFSSPSLYELTVDHRKLVGSAQRRWLKVFLQHGSIPIQTDRSLEKELIVSAIKGRQKTVRLSELFDMIPSLEKLKNALAFGFEKRLGTTLQKGSLTVQENAHIQELVQTRYAAEAWTHRR